METVKINMVPKGAVKAAHASQGDASRVVRFELFDEFLPYTLDGSEVITLTVVRPDTEEIVSSVTNTEEAYIDVSFTSEMTAIRGVANCEIKISKSGAEIGSHNFDLNIERDAYGEDITVETAQGVIATFTTGVIDNLVSLKTTFEPIQDLHGYSSPWIDSNVVNKTPYLSRSLSGTASRIGNYEFNKLVGGTYAFNQLLTKTPDGTATINGIEYVTVNGITTANGNNNTGVTSSLSVAENSQYYKDHVYYLGGCALGGSENTYRLWVNSNTAFPLGYRLFDAGNGAIKKARDTENLAGAKIQIQVLKDVSANNLVFKPQLIDLTQLFGSTIADYIYSLETAQAGAGVSFFKALFDKDYYPYNAGELISVKPTAHITKDGNNTVISNTALDPDLELRGIPKLDANNNLYYDGDTYESNGDVTRRYGIVDLGSLNWSYNSNNATFYTTGVNDFYAIQNDTIIIYNCLCIKYVTLSRSRLYDLDKGISLNWSDVRYISIKDPAYTDPAAFKASLSGVYLVYEKASSTTESADPFTDPQEIDASGSEEFTDNRSVPIPVGHESYYANICEIEGIDEITFYHSGEDTQDPESALVEIGQTVYGGYYDKDLGIVLTSKLVDLGSYTWYKIGMGDGRQGFRATFDDMELTPASNIPINALCSVYPILNGNQVYLGNIGLAGWGADTQAVAIYDPLHESDTINEFKAFVNGIKVCYKLADPIIIPADKVNLTTVKGVNNVWSDTNGETEVKFFVKES